jgi:hypothetical protein
MHVQRMRGSTADLVVSGSGILAIIRIQNAPRLHGPPAEIAAEFRDAIALLRLHPAGSPVSRELWLYSRYGVLRYFRVEESGIVELGADGSVLPEVSPAPATTRKSTARMKKPVVPEQPRAGGRPEDPAAGGKIPVAPKRPVPAESPGVPVSPGTDVVTVKQEPVAGDAPGPGG